MAGFKSASRAARSSFEGREGATGSWAASWASAIGSGENGGMEKFGGASSRRGGGGSITGKAVVSTSGPSANPVESLGGESGPGMGPSAASGDT